MLCVAGLLALKTWIEERQQAAGLVQRLLDADTAQVPGLVGELAGYRRWADPLLRQELEKDAPESSRRLHASLGLAPVDVAAEQGRTTCSPVCSPPSLRRCA